MTRFTTLGRTRIAAIYIDCPRENCGGGVESRGTGSFLLTVDDLRDLVQDTFQTCGTCLEPIRVPVKALELLQR